MLMGSKYKLKTSDSLDLFVKDENIQNVKYSQQIDHLQIYSVSIIETEKLGGVLQTLHNATYEVFIHSFIV